MLKLRVAGKYAKRSKSQPEGLAGWVLARLSSFRGSRVAEQRQMRLLETLPLGGKRQLMLVECGGERYLVGGGLESVQTIVALTRSAASRESSSNEECR